MAKLSLHVLQRLGIKESTIQSRQRAQPVLIALVMRENSPQLGKQKIILAGGAEEMHWSMARCLMQWEH